MYQVIEHAGMDNERVVYETSSYVDAVMFVHTNYSPEQEDMNVDVLKNGTTEF